MSTFRYSGGNGFYYNDRSLSAYQSVLPTISLYTSNALIGINTSTPVAALDVNGNINCWSNLSLNGSITLSNTANYSLTMNAGTAGNQFQIAAAYASGQYSASAVSGDVIQRTTGTGQMYFQNGTNGPAMNVANNNQVYFYTPLNSYSNFNLYSSLGVSSNVYFNGIACSNSGNESIAGSLHVGGTLAVNGLTQPVAAYPQLILRNSVNYVDITAGSYQDFAFESGQSNLYTYPTDTFFSYVSGTGFLGAGYDASSTPNTWAWARVVFRAFTPSSSSSATMSLGIYYTIPAGTSTYVATTDQSTNATWNANEAGLNLGYQTQVSPWISMGASTVRMLLHNNDSSRTYRLGSVIMQFRT